MTATENAFGKCCLVEPASGKGNSSTDKKQTNKKNRKENSQPQIKMSQDAPMY